MKYDSAQEVLSMLIQYYYTERNIEKTLECVSEDVEWIGTQREERASDKKTLERILQAVKKEVPDSILIDFKPFKEHKLADGISMLVVEGQYHRSRGIAYDYDIRATVCCVRSEHGWLVQSVHASTPNIGKIRQELENKLTNTEKKEQVLRNSIPGGTAIYRLKKDGRVETEYVSDTLARLTGYKDYHELLDLVHDNAKNGIPLEDWSRVIGEVKAAIEKDEPISLTYHVISGSGDYIDLHMNANVIMDNQSEDDIAVLYAVHTLVSNQEKREQRHYRTVMNLLGIAYWEWSRDYGLYSSEMFQRYELSRKSIDLLKNNQVFDDAIHPDDIGKLREFFSHGDQKEEQAGTIIRLKLVDGSYQWTEIFGFKEYAEDGETLRLSCVMRGADKEWVDQKSQLQKALQDAEKASQSKSEFLTRISHDMRTPLNGIKNFAQFAMESESLEDSKEYCSKIAVSEKYLETLINDTLRMSRIEAGKVELKLEPYIYSEFEPGIRNVVETKAAEKGVTLRFIAPPPAEQRYVLLDRTRMQQIFVNIINNAIKFTPKGGLVEIRTELLEQTKNYENIRISISDTGIGMHEDFIENKLFKPFAQEHIGKDNEETGTGLGLSIVKQLINLMDGTIACHSTIGEGTTFVVTIPARRAPKESGKESTGSNYDIEKLKNKRILLCEDHPLNREIAIRLLSKAGCVIETAEDGAIGVSMYRNSANRPYDVILMDIRMPNIDGMEAARQIRRSDNQDAQTIPIIAMTANAYEEDIKLCLEAGMNAHLAKPIDVEELYQTIYNSLYTSH